jgi:hypothetical protein
MMQQWIVHALVQTRRAADDHHRGLFRKRAGDTIANTQAANAIRNANRSHSIDPRISVRRKAGTIFTRATHDVDRALFQHAVKRQHIIAWDAKQILDAVILKAIDQILSNRNLGRTSSLFSGHGFS